MSANSKGALHIDASDFPVYDTEDLNLFQSILDDILKERASNYLSAGEREYLRAQLAVAIFKSAGTGERNYARLKQSAIDAVSAVPSSEHLSNVDWVGRDRPMLTNQAWSRPNTTPIKRSSRAC